jgi:molecular chaperone DnaK
VLLLDVTPLTLGIETEGGIMTALIERNTTIPAEKKNTFSTASDNQTAVTVKVFQGERKMAQQNRLLGEFNLEGIAASPRGVPQIEVQFDIDQNGILNVSAKDVGTGKQASVKIEQSSGLKKDEIERMRRDAEMYAEEDRKAFELAEAKNRGENLVYQVEKLMKENAEKITDGDRQPLERSIQKVRDAVGRGFTDEIKSASGELEQAMIAFSKVLYEKGGASGPTPGDSNDPGDTIDADFERK